MSLTYQRSRITGAGLVAAQYDLTLERQTIMDNILFIPGIANPVSEINQLLFGQGQQGTFIAPSLTASLISGSTFGTGVETLPDLSPRNNPFSQANSGNRAAWFREPKTGRRNLLIRTEEFGNPVWSTVDATVSKVPDVEGINTWQIEGTASSARVSQFVDAITVPCVFSFLAYSLDARTYRVRIIDDGVAFLSSNISHTGSGWERISLPITPSGAGVTLVGINRTTAGPYLVGHPQLELGSTPTAYQRVTTAFDVTESGQRDCFGVRADGIDDWYQTAGNVDFSGTDKVTVFAAVRKLSDAASGILAELSNSPTTDGSFRLFAPSADGDNSYRFTSKGDGTARTAGTGVFAAAPDISILTGIGDISGPLVSLRRNGALVQAVTSSQGGGNYTSGHPLYLFSRGGTTNFLNGSLYALIIAGGSYPLSTIQRVERILSRITPTVNL